MGENGVASEPLDKTSETGKILLDGALVGKHEKTKKLHSVQWKDARPLILSLLVSLCSVSLMVLPLPHAASADGKSLPGAEATELISSASLLLPPGKTVLPAIGEREVWLLPVLSEGAEEWNASRLLKDADAKLSWFARHSGGRFSMDATRVLPTVRYEPDSSGKECNSMVRAWSFALQEFMMLAPAGVHLVGLTRAKDCPYRGIGETPGRWALIANLNNRSEVREFTLIHELGHNLGLPHASAVTGGALSFSPEPAALSSTVDEYGDATDIMGTGSSLSPVGRTLLGWDDGVEWIDGSKAVSIVHRLKAPEKPGADGLVVDDPISGKRYLFSYVDTPGLRGKGGLVMHEVLIFPPGTEYSGRQSLTHWIPWNKELRRFAAGPGTAWLSDGGALSVRVLERGRDSVTIRVRVQPAGGLRDSMGPTWPIMPSIIRDGGAPRISLFGAWDQSGVVNYRVVTSSGLVASVELPSSLSSTTVRLPVLRRNMTVMVEVTDSLGNSSRWVRKIKTP